MYKFPHGRLMSTTILLTMICLLSQITVLTDLNAQAKSLPAVKEETIQEVPKPEKSKRPKYQNLRWNENWSYLAYEDSSDPFDTLKYIPLSDDEDFYISIGGQLRLRYEYWNNFGFVDAPDGSRDDDFLLTRLRLHSDIHLSKYLRFFIEGKFAESTDRDLPGGARSLDVDTAAVQNAFFDIWLPLTDDESLSVTIRGGRQELSFGKQRLVSPLDWSNTRRTFDAISAIIKYEKWKIHAFYSRPVVIELYDENESSETDDFYGVYANGPIGGGQNLDLYYLGLERDRSITFNGTAGEEDRHTFGSRLYGKLGGGVSYDLEGAYQTGSVGAGDVNAFMVASRLDYALPVDSSLKPAVYLGFDYSSGDDEAGGDVETFNQLFPLGHAYNGFIDILGRQNIIDLSTGFKLKPTKKSLFKFDFHQFWRSSTDDGAYNAGGGLVRPGSGGDSSNIGQEIDLTFVYNLDKHAKIVTGYSHFFAGDFIEQSGRSDDIDFAYLAFQYTF